MARDLRLLLLCATTSFLCYNILQCPKKEIPFERSGPYDPNHCRGQPEGRGGEDHHQHQSGGLSGGRTEKTLLVDLDAQGNATSGLGIDKSSLERCLYDALINHTELEEIIQPTAWKDLWVAPATMNLAGAEIDLIEEKESPQMP